MTQFANLYFKPEQRLRNGADYDTVFSDPLRSRDQYFLLLTRNNHKSHPRLGLIVSKKKIRRAVSRNRIKRIIRNSFRLNQHQLPDVDIIVLVYSQADQADTVELEQSLLKHWKKLNRKFKH